MSVLFTPLRVGDLELANRIIIAPMSDGLEGSFAGGSAKAGAMKAEEKGEE
jgi:2,4-dienoyl-CoA reductase-like NADH-dependent reductase (Old Yellow Enzyme family)